jgi:hypothetical protein
MGGPWANRSAIGIEAAASLLAGTNTAGDRARLLCTASTVVGGIEYVLVVFGDRGSRTPARGRLDRAGFAKALGPYRGPSCANKNCYVVRLGADGGLASFERDEPFVREHFGRFAA